MSADIISLPCLCPVSFLHNIILPWEYQQTCCGDFLCHIPMLVWDIHCDLHLHLRLGPPLSLVIIPGQWPTSPLHNPLRIWTWDFLGCCLSMNIPFPSLEVPCLVLSFQFHNLCHKECVSRFDLARLSLRLGPTLPCPVHPPPSPVPGRYPWPKSFMHIAPCQFQNMNGIITHALHISPIFLHNMYEWVTVHSGKKN